MNQNKLILLLDTQADISVLKLSSIELQNPINTAAQVLIKGVTHESIQTVGTLRASLSFNSLITTMDFHIVPEEFNIPVDGILGRDFLHRHNCIINYNNNTLTVNNQVSVPILEGPGETIIIPPRSETIRRLHVNQTEDCIIKNHEIVPGVFIPRAIVNPSNAYVPILNTTDKYQIIRKLCTNTMPLSEYTIYKIDPIHSSSERTAEVLKILKKDMPTETFSLLHPILEEYADTFALSTDKMSINNFYTQKLNIIDNQPCYTKNYRIPHTHKIEVDNQVQNLLKNDLIEPSFANYNSPVILVPKKGTAKHRMCVDYRKINTKIMPDRYPLPRIDEILEGLGRTRFFSVIDLYSGFHQIPLDEPSRDITSFSTNTGSYRWKVLPFGLNIAPNSFARMMNIAFTGLSPSKMFLYLDDIIVIGNSEQHHLKNLEAVLHTCRLRNLKINPEKCHFFKPEVTFLGHVCTDKGIQPDPSKFFSINNYPIPHDADATRRFVAMSNFYRKFIPDFSLLTLPLNKMTRKNTIFRWTPECQHSFDELKNHLTSPKTLAYPDFTTEFTLTVDASKTGCGAVLSQNDLPIAFASKAFSKADMNKATIEQELIAIHWSIRHFKFYLLGNHFTVKSDHKPLIYLFNMKDPTSKLTRLRLELAEFDFTIHHIPGKDNVVADALSRIHIKDLINQQNALSIKFITRSMTRQAQLDLNKPTQPISIPTLTHVTEVSENYTSKKTPLFQTRFNTNEQQIYMRINKYHSVLSLSGDNLNNAKLFLRETFAWLNNEAVKNSFIAIKIFANDPLFKICAKEQFIEIGNKMLQDLTIFIVNQPIFVHNSADRQRLIETYHSNPIFGGHLGKKRLHAKIRQKFTWPKLVRDVARHVDACHQCKINKPIKSNTEPLFLTTNPHKPFDRIVVDTIGPMPLTTSGMKYAVTIICDLTKYIITTAVPNKEAATVARAIINSCILIYGVPKQILTDMGTEYKNSIMQEICQILQIDQNFSTPNHHETVGSIERNHRTFNEYVRSYLTENTDWDELLLYFSLCYNTTPHTSFNLKYSPFELVFGKINNPPDILKNNIIDPVYNFDSVATQFKFNMQLAHKHAKLFLNNSKIRTKQYYDKQANPLNLKINDTVLVTDETRTKFNPLYKGPFKVVNIDSHNVTIFDPNTKKTKVVHKNNVRKYLK